ncbi:hypothetical protein ABIE27_006013 [Paenibacillus sp. 4624]|uniref:replication protein n=1 Tax=Paenibacillus sp. 4624 TaxID=3156453 RepID=UPI003D1B4321
MTDSRRRKGFITIANEIWDEVIRRDFTKRQKDILFFVWRLSFGCNRKTALIPQLRDFELCGVGKTNITKELKLLEECKVITWNRSNNKFSFNEDFEIWKVTLVKRWDDDRFKGLIRLNLNESKASQVIETITDPEAEKRESSVIDTITNDLGIELSKQEPENTGAVIEMITINENELLKQELPVIETITTTSIEPIQDASSGASKDSLKTLKDKDSKDMVISDFESFWNSYPKKAAKKAAQNMWDRAIKAKVKPELLIQCSQHYAQHCLLNKTETNFIMHGSTFLNPKNERYADFTEPQVQTANVPATNIQNKRFSQNKELLISRMQEGQHERNGNNRIDVTNYYGIPPS